MRYLPITQDNLKNAAALYINVYNAEPWNIDWSYSTAYARLMSIVKSPGFTGFLCIDDDGMPCSLIMGNMEPLFDGSFYFNIKDFCVEPSKQGRGIGTEVLNYLIDNIKRQNINKIHCHTLSLPDTEQFLKGRGFKEIDNIITMEMNI